MRRVTRRERDATAVLEGIHMNPGVGPVDIYHLTNTLTVSQKPWLVTFEHYLPRWAMHSRLGLTLMARPQCRRILAMSDYAYRTQRSLLEAHPEFAARILPKMSVLHPAQRSLGPKLRPRPRTGGRLMFSFVGNDFFRKGGREILLVFERLLAEGEPVRLLIVSSLDAGDYASHTTANDVAWARATMARMGEHVEQYTSVPNPDVLEFFARSDVSLLPTYHDTYGYSALESQAAGCPVITTDCCALHEINDPSMGWQIPVPTDPLGNPLIGTVAERTRLSAAIQEGLYAAMKEVCRNPDLAPAKGERALQRLIAMHDPATVQATSESYCLQAADDSNTDRPAPRQSQDTSRA